MHTSVFVLRGAPEAAGGGGGALGRLETPSKLRAKSWCGPKEQTTGDTWVLRCLRHFIEPPQLDLTYKNDK